ncbi:MAG: response regulator transcription factor [Actinomycetota bacterium]
MGSVETSADRIRVLLLDDHEIVLRGVADLLEGAEDLDVVAMATTGAEALRLAESARPDVAVLDIRLGDGNGIDVCRRIRTANPRIACVIFTAFQDDAALVEAADAGAAAYVLKQVRGNELVDSIRKVASGSVLLDAASVRLGRRRLQEAEGEALHTLTAQERKVFDLIGQGYSNREIADELFLAEKTVKNYASNMLAKLGLRRRTEVAVYATQLEERRRRRYD